MSYLTKRDGIDLITAERERQVADEHFTLTHDDMHDKGELTTAALCYLRAALTTLDPDSPNAAAPVGPPSDWPWEEDWYKPEWSNPIRALSKAGALIAAEIDRLKRQESRV